MIPADIRRRLYAIELLAKDASIPFELLEETLARFLIDVNYTRTTYRLFNPVLFRARSKAFSSISSACQYFDNAEKLTYPDIKKFKPSWGRCNDPEEAVFYCSDENVIPMFEIRPEPGQYLVLSRYRHQKDATITLELPVIGVTQLVDSLKQRTDSRNLEHILSKDMHYFATSSKEVLALDQYFAGWFTQVVDDSCKYYYRLTTALYRCFTKHVVRSSTGKGFCGLLYPSVAGELSGINFALETGFVDNNIRLLDAMLYEVESVDLIAKRFVMQPLKEISGIYSDGRLEWKDYQGNGKRFIFDPSTPAMRITPSSDFLDYYNTIHQK